MLRQARHEGSFRVLALSLSKGEREGRERTHGSRFRHCMEIYLPIAGVTENALVLLGVGLGVGLLSGLFGVGGGFLLTPLLIFLGVPSPIAVAPRSEEHTSELQSLMRHSYAVSCLQKTTK